MKLKRFLALLCLLCLVCSCAMAQEETPARITAVGSAQVSFAADWVVLALNVQVEGKTVTEAQSLADAALEKLKASLAELGVGDDDVTPGQMSIESQYQFHYTRLNEQEILSGYQITNHVKVLVRDLSSLGAAIDAAIAGGAQSDYELSCESGQTGEAYAQALTQAVQSAMAKAQTLAQAAGLNLGDLISVTETAPASPVQTSPSTLTVEATAEVCYAVKN